MTNLDCILKSRDITLPTKVCLVKAMVFPVVMYGCESWTIKKAECRRIDAFELWCWRRLLRVPWTARISNQPILKDAEAETPILWPPDAKNWLLGKDPDARKNWRQEKGTTEDKMVGWHHQLDGCKFEQVPGVGDGQGSLACCSPRSLKESDMTERLNWLTDVHSSTAYNSQDVETTWMSNDRWMDKDKWFIFTMEFHSAIKKEWKNVTCSNKYGHRDYHTKWSQNDAIPVYHLYVESKKWYKWIYLHKTETDSHA